MTDKPSLVSMFEEAEQATQESRQLAERDRDYRDNKQWTAEEEQALKKRKQPVVTYNRISRKVDYLLGLEKQMRKDPKCFPRTPDDELAAQAATDALRFVCEDTFWDDKRSEAMENLVVEGTCAIMVGAKNVKQGVDPELIHIPWDRLFYDPHSRRADFSDASYMGIVTWMDLSEAKAKYQDKEDILDATMTAAKDTETYDDKPKHHLWADTKRRRVRIIEGYYLVKGVWYRCIATGSGELEESAPSPYLDEEGQPENPIKAISYYIDRDNNRYGGVRVMISPQDEINKRRSKALHLITMRQARVGLGASKDPEDIRRELARPDGVIQADAGEFEILDHNDMASANLQMLQEAKAEIDLLGANAALMGKNENDMSGRAILAQQQGGMVEVAMLFDRLRVLSMSVYRSMWARIRQYWKGERWIRVTDDEQNLRFVGLNQPVTVGQLAEQVMSGDEEALKTAMESLGPQVAQLIQAAMQGDQQAQMMLAMFVRQNGNQVVQVENQVSELDVDIVIDEGMDTPTVQAEQFDTLAKVLPTAVNLPPPYLKALIMASSLRDKDKLLEEVDQASQGPQIPPEMQAQMQEMAQALEQLQSENAELKGAVEDKSAEREMKGQELAIKGEELKVSAFEAQTARILALKPEPDKRDAA